MAETLISPGVLATENDQSFISQGPISVGAALIGPTVKGPVEIPTIVTSYSDYQAKFGTTFNSGGQAYTYFTSIAAYNYFNNGGESLLVARVVSGAFAAASSSVQSNTGSLTTASVTISSASLASISPGFGTTSAGTGSFVVNGITITVTGSTLPANTSTIIYVSTGSNYAATLGNITASFNFSSSVSPYSTNLQYITASISGSTGLFFNAKTSISGYTGNSYYVTLGSTTTYFSGGTNNTSFVLETLSEGTIMNDAGAEDSAGALASGSNDNVRYQIVNASTSSGTFDLLIRRGNDTTNNQTVLETWTNLSLDPFAPNYIAAVIGDYVTNYNASTNQVEITGSYPNRSAYVRVKSVNLSTPNYFDNNGTAISAYTSSIPINISGAFGGATGDLFYGGNAKYYNAINTSATNLQGITASDYNNMISLLANQDDYRFNVLLTPGLFSETATLGSSQVTTAINNTQNRGDSIYVIDLASYGYVGSSNVSSVTSLASARNTSYAAAYWPWVQTIDPDLGKNVWVPASTMIGGVYAYNDSVSEPWFAPAGINRGGLSNVIRAEFKLNQSQRDTLYSGKVNPIATFPGQGTVVYGQKTLQTKASALDRVNVRRLLIALKSYISQVAQNLVFEQNSIATRNQFLSQVNPYLASVQQRQGLYAFRVIMDDSNNTPDVIDRNQLVGQIYIQPTKTAEFIYLDFNILPTGVLFPA
jgi:phage tail sheath protein FI